MRPVSKKMWIYLIISFLLMVIHKIECFFTGEYLVAPFFKWIQGYVHSIPEAIFFTFIFWFFLLMIVVILLLRGGLWPLILLSLYGLMFAVEFHHILRSVESRAYYSGSFSAVAFILWGIPYWRELISNYKSKTI